MSKDIPGLCVIPLLHHSTCYLYFLDSSASQYLGNHVGIQQSVGFLVTAAI
jgi:hypothetical protein